MKRKVLDLLVDWSKKPDSRRKPLILRGARQVGKTWLLEELGRTAFENCVHINFQKQAELQGLFEPDLDTDRILRTLEIAASQKILPGKTLIILDEIQEARGGVTSLKYFKEDAPQYCVAAAGSLLGVAMHKDTSFPVGKVEFINVYPMSFTEFLWALGKDSLAELTQSGDWSVASVFSSQLEELLRLYYYIGGMPEAVLNYVSLHDLDEVRKVQSDLLLTYDNDFSKYPPSEEVPRIRMVWQSISGQLAKENKKFVYGALKHGARAAEYEKAIQWLVDAGLVIKVTRVTAGELPLSGFEDKDAFKLYLMDVGLLGAMCGLDKASLLDGISYFAQYKGALTEQYVCQQLQGILYDDGAATSNGETRIHYWKPDTGTSEVDFLFELSSSRGRLPIPLEAKAEDNLKAKSLKTFIKKYSPAHAFKASMTGRFMSSGGDVTTAIPLYMLACLKATLEKALG